MSRVLTLCSILFGSIFGEPGMYQTRSELSEMSCLAEWPNLIIRTTESIRNGAVFLDSVDIASPQQCDALCCENSDCNVAILTKFNQCFLFSCIDMKEGKFVCTFSQNPNFKTYVKVTQILQYYAAHNLDSVQSNATVEHDKQNVAETKEEDGECPRLFWTCDNQVDCIPAWHVCDASPDCPDGSDERECPTDIDQNPDPQAELHVLKDVGESVEEKAQEEIKNEKKKTGIQVILPLCLGLLLMILAWIAVYLRYRQARHRAGLTSASQYKPLPKEDSDYLINGMYM